MVSYEEIAKYAFMAFAIIAIVAGLGVGYMAYDKRNVGGFMSTDVKDIHAYVTLIMLVLGIIVGLISVTAKEVTPFLIASIALIVAGLSGGGISTGYGYTGVWWPLGAIESLQVLYYLATAILSYIAAFVAPGAVIIAIKSFWAIAKEK